MASILFSLTIIVPFSIISSPSSKKGKYGVEVKYEAKVGKTYAETKKLVVKLLNED